MQGLTSGEAAARLERDGPNTLPEPERSVGQVIRRQLDDVLVWLLLGALVLSTVLPFVEHGGWPGLRAFVDAAVIGAILVLNLVLGVVQVFRAERAIAALAKLAAPEVTVRRDGREQRLASAGLVVGDVVLLEAGERVPADARVAASSFLEVDESLLTGESVPVGKRAGGVDVEAPVAERPTMVHAGSLVTRGTAEVEVSAAGARTEAGRIAGLMAAAEAPETPLERQLAGLGKVLGLAALAVCVVVAALGWYRQMPFIELLLVGISLAVSAVPEGLPAIVTVCFAAGMRHMSARQALVRRLDALETLGAVTVIATDKTGTLTANEMTVVEHWGPDGLLARIGASCNHAASSGLGRHAP